VRANTLVSVRERIAAYRRFGVLADCWIVLSVIAGQIAFPRGLAKPPRKK